MKADFHPDLPANWIRTPLKHASALNPEVLPENTSSDLHLEYVDISALEGGTSDLTPKQLTFGEAPSRARRTLRSGDTIISTVRTYLRAVATFPKVESNLVASTGFAVLRQNGRLHNRFAYWAVLAEPFIESVVAHSDGVSYPAITPSVLGTLNVVVPPFQEQERIAHFLDEHTARIDALILEKERLQTTLKSVVWDEVTRAVTQGIDGAVTKNTQLDWCPNIPSHWDVLLLKRLFSRTEYGISESMSPEGNVGVLRMGNINDGAVLMDDLKFVDTVENSLLLQPGDVLYNRTNSLALVGKVGLVKEVPPFPVTFASYLVRLVPNQKVMPEYLVYLLNCPDVLAIARSLALPAIGQANLNPTRYGYIHVPCPPVDEQRRIVEYLNGKTASVSALAAHVDGHIERLREYRASLISSAVTGQLDLESFKEAA